jgi:hypothetical protein
LKKRLAAIGAVALILIGWIASGIVGNRADAAFVAWAPTVADFLVTPWPIPPWLLLLLLAVVLIGIAVLVAALRRRTADEDPIRPVAGDEDPLEVAVALLELDETLFRLLAQLVANADRTRALEQLLREFLRDATRVFGGDVSRALVLTVEGDALAGWIGYQMPEETIARSRFPLDAPDVAGQGVALRTFREGKLHVVRLEHHDGIWQADSRDYREFSPERPHPPYRSFVSVPVPSNGGGVRGVLCFDSMNPGAFDSPEVQRFLATLAQRVAAAITIHDHFERTLSPH